VSYFFVDEEAFRAMIDRGRVSSEWSTVYGELKGRTFETVNRSLGLGEGHGHQDRRPGGREGARPNGRRRYLIFLLPPSLDALEQRLIERGTEDPASLRSRHERAVAELALKDTYDHQVVNDDAKRAAQEIRGSIIQACAASRREPCVPGRSTAIASLVGVGGSVAAFKHARWFTDLRRDGAEVEGPR